MVRGIAGCDAPGADSMSIRTVDGSLSLVSSIANRPRKGVVCHTWTAYAPAELGRDSGLRCVHGGCEELQHLHFMQLGVGQRRYGKGDVLVARVGEAGDIPVPQLPRQRKALAVESILGEHDVNIASMQVGRDAPRGNAMMILAVDDRVSSEVLERLRGVGGMSDLRYVELGTQADS